MWIDFRWVDGLSLREEQISSSIELGSQLEVEVLTSWGVQKQKQQVLVLDAALLGIASAMCQALAGRLFVPSCCLQARRA